MGDFGIKWGSFTGWVLCRELLVIHREIGVVFWMVGFSRDLLVDVGRMHEFVSISIILYVL